MGRSKLLKSIIVSALLVLVVVLSIFFAKNNNEPSEIDKAISRYENILVNRDSYQDGSNYVDITLDVKDTYCVFTFSVKDTNLDDVIIIVSNKHDNMSYGIKDSVGSDFVVDGHNPSEGKLKGVKIVFEKSDEYYIYLSFMVDGNEVNEYIKLQ